MKPIELRLVRLERERAANRATQSYVVRVPAEAMGDSDAVRTAIEEHRRVTGRAGWVVVAPAAMTKSEWLARYGGLTEAASREDQELAQQRAALRTAGCVRLFEEKASGGRSGPPRAAASA